MINIDKGYIKNTPEYEDLGENIFPMDALTDEEKLELGLIKSCCSSKGGCCSGKKTSRSCCQRKRNNDQCGK